jgi:predicted dithiol-disulfide oxidoreductase (DUF899 family)
MTTNAISHFDLPPVVSPQEWWNARKQFLLREKEFTKTRDRLNSCRRNVPVVIGRKLCV